ncbi:MAG: receptor ligand binding region family protein [Conexibacter sp.]|nr:receptor ligand binding region family protein [Conexibacter sp.]
MRRLLVGVVACTALVGAGCGTQDSGSSGGGGGDTIEVGAVIPLSGGTADVGRQVKAGYELAKEQINAAGGIDGRKLRFVYADSAGDPATGGREARRLARAPGTVALTGSYASAVTLVVAQTAEQSQVPYLVPYSAANKITESGFKWTFRTRPPSSRWAETMAQFLKARSADGGRPITKIGLLVDDTEYGQGTAKDYRAAAKNAGLQVVSQQTFTEGDTNLTTQVSKLKASGAQAILAASYLESTQGALRTMDSLGYAVPYMTIGTGLVAPELFDMGSLADGAAGSTSWAADLQNPASKQFVTEFGKANGGLAPSDDAAYAYAVSFIVKQALEGAKDPSRSALADALRSKSFTLPQANITPSTTGAIKFDAKGQANTIILIDQAQGKAFKTVFPPKYAAAKVIPGKAGWFR